MLFNVLANSFDTTTKLFLKTEFVTHNFTYLGQVMVRFFFKLEFAAFFSL